MTTIADVPFGHISHFVWVSRPENADGYAELIASIFGAEYEGTNEPEQLPVRSFTSWETGLEISSPLSESEELRTVRFLKERGEGPYALCIRVEDLDESTRKMRSKGISVSDPHYELTGKEPWAYRFKTLREAYIDEPIIGMQLVLVEYELA